MSIAAHTVICQKCWSTDSPFGAACGSAFGHEPVVLPSLLSAVARFCDKLNHPERLCHSSKDNLPSPQLANEDVEVRTRGAIRSGPAKTGVWR